MKKATSKASKEHTTQPKVRYLVSLYRHPVVRIVPLKDMEYPENIIVEGVDLNDYNSFIHWRNNYLLQRGYDETQFHYMKIVSIHKFDT